MADNRFSQRGRAVVNVSEPLLDKSLRNFGRDLSGRFARGQTQAVKAHEIMAEEAALLVQKVLVERVDARGREQRKAQVLIKAIVAPENRHANLDGWVVGTDYLKTTAAAPYYRNLEEGTNIFVGRVLTGGFFGLRGDFLPPGENRNDQRLFQTGTTFARKDDRTIKDFQGNQAAFDDVQAFNSRNKRAARIKILSQDKIDALDLAPRPEGFRIRIKEPILPYNYFREGGRLFKESDRIKQIYRIELGKVGIPVP